jgi:hypothetical protein
MARLDLVADWAAFVADDVNAEHQRSRAGERACRLLGEPALIDRLESALGRRIHRQKPGPQTRPRPRTAAMRVVSL